MKKILMLSVLVLLTGCTVQAERTLKSTNEEFKVEELFTVKNCTVYRFHDDGREHWFTSCTGSVSYNYHSGKSSHGELIPTN